MSRLSKQLKKPAAVNTCGFKAACCAFFAAVDGLFDDPAEPGLCVHAEHKIAEEEYAARNTIANEATTALAEIHLLQCAAAVESTQTLSEKLHSRAVAELGIFNAVMTGQGNIITEEATLRDELKTLEGDDTAIVREKEFVVIK